MPYIMVEELPEGVEAADVVSKSDYDALSKSLSDAEGQRDALVTKAEQLQGELAESRRKYADAFINAAAAAAPEPTEPESKPEPKHKTSFASLFK